MNRLQIIMRNEAISMKTLFNCCCVSALLIGCLLQVVKICEMYFKYPTNVLIETKFDAIERQLPSITLCQKSVNSFRGKHTHQLFEMFPIGSTVSASIHMNGNSKSMVENLTQFVSNNALESISIKYYCLTLNSVLKGNQ